MNDIEMVTLDIDNSPGEFLTKSPEKILTVASSFFRVIVASFLGIFVPRLV